MPLDADGDRRFSKLAWMDVVRRYTGINAMRRLVILHIGATANADGERAFRATDLVVGELGTSPSTVTRSRQDALRLGLWVETAPARGGRGGGVSAEYRLLMPTELVVTGDTHSDGNGGHDDTHSDRNGGHRSTNGGHRSAEWWSPVTTPSVLPSVLPSEREAPSTDETPIDAETVPKSGNAPSPMSPHADEQATVVVGEVMDETPPDHEPPRHCPAHMPYGTSLSCGGCKIARLNHEAWRRRNPNHRLGGLLAQLGLNGVATPVLDSASASPQCHYCRGGGWVLMSDGTPGWRPRRCLCDGMGGRREPTVAELAELDSDTERAQ